MNYPRYQRQTKTGHFPPRQAFTLVELLVVISIIGVLAALVTGLAGPAMVKSKLKRAESDLNFLVTAIEQYKAKYGSYPPDNNLSLADRSVPNQLYYELTGTLYDPTARSFYSETRNETFSSSDIKTIFGRDSFVNSIERRDVANTKEYRNYALNLKPSMTNYVTAGSSKVITALVLPIQRPGATKATDINAWHYISTNPTNNPSTFDLWTDVLVSKRTYLISNWKQ